MYKLFRGGQIENRIIWLQGRSDVDTGSTHWLLLKFSPHLNEVILCFFTSNQLESQKLLRMARDKLEVLQVSLNQLFFCATRFTRRAFLETILNQGCFQRNTSRDVHIHRQKWENERFMLPANEPNVRFCEPGRQVTGADYPALNFSRSTS